MSKNVKQIIQIPEGTTLFLTDECVRGVGKEGSFERAKNVGIDYSISDGKFKALNKGRYTNAKDVNAFIGLELALLANAIKGISEGHTKSVVIKGVGFSFKLNSEKPLLELKAGFTHPVAIEIPKELTIKLQSPTQIIIKGSAKDQVGTFAAKVREIRPPEPYKGKGIRYFNEVITLKPGKTRK